MENSETRMGQENWEILQISCNFRRTRSGDEIWIYCWRCGRYVVGATKAAYFKEIRKILPTSFLLVPGVGAQGGNLQEVCKYGLSENIGLLINSSRGIIYASKEEEFAQKAALKARELQQEMAEILTTRFHL